MASLFPDGKREVFLGSQEKNTREMMERDGGELMERRWKGEKKMKARRKKLSRRERMERRERNENDYKMTKG
ncbi:MAG: hypothetical protein IIZ39_03525 [Blautia sp.]|nr:hypothetical protein [Blautia sp.]